MSLDGKHTSRMQLLPHNCVIDPPDCTVIVCAPFNNHAKNCLYKLALITAELLNNKKGKINPIVCPPNGNFNSLLCFGGAARRPTLIHSHYNLSILIHSLIHHTRQRAPSFISAFKNTHVRAIFQ
jgi:hypothetical protein